MSEPQAVNVYQLRRWFAREAERQMEAALIDLSGMEVHRALLRIESAKGLLEASQAIPEDHVTIGIPIGTP